jgi:hypothetical protein
MSHKRILAVAATCREVSASLVRWAKLEHRHGIVQLLETRARELERAAATLRSIASDKESGGWLPPFFQK